MGNAAVFSVITHEQTDPVTQQLTLSFYSNCCLVPVGSNNVMITMAITLFLFAHSLHKHEAQAGNWVIFHAN